MCIGVELKFQHFARRKIMLAKKHEKQEGNKIRKAVTY